MWLHPDQDYIFPRMDALFARAQKNGIRLLENVSSHHHHHHHRGAMKSSSSQSSGEEEAEKTTTTTTTTTLLRPIDASNRMEREAAWKAWFAFMSAKHFQADAKEQNASMEEVKNNATFLAELLEKERRKVREKSKKAPVGRPKMRKDVDATTTTKEETKTPKLMTARSEKGKEATTTTIPTTSTATASAVKTTATASGINMDQAKAIQHCDDGKKKITIRFTPDSERVAQKIKATKHNPIVDLTFRLRKKLGDICDHFSEKWKEAAKILEEEARAEERERTGNENGLKNKAFMFTMRPNMRGDNLVNMEPCVVWDKQIIGDMTAVKAYEMRGYPETFEIKYSWRFAPLPPPDGSGEKKRKEYTYKTKLAIKEQMIMNRDFANNNNTNKFDFSTVFDEKTRTPLPPPDFTMSAFDVGAFVNGDEPPATKLSRQEKKRKTDTSSRKKGGKGKEFEKKPVPKEVKPETDSMLALKLQAELNGGNRERRNRKPMLEGEEGEGEEEEYGKESDLENDDGDVDDDDNNNNNNNKNNNGKIWTRTDGGKENNTSDLPQGLTGYESIFAGIGKEDDASRPCGDSTMNGFAQAFFGGGGESKDATAVGACLRKGNAETGPSNFAGLLSASKT